MLGRLMLIGGVTEDLGIGHVRKCGHDWLVHSQKKQADVGSKRKNPVAKCMFFGSNLMQHISLLTGHGRIKLKYSCSSPSWTLS